MAVEEIVRIWYNLGKLSSYNAPLNFVIGARGTGKTYAGKESALKKWLRNKAEWVYVRRTLDEIQIAKTSLWGDLLPAYGYETRTKGHICYIRPRFIEEEYEDEKGKIRKTKPEPWEIFGYFIALSEQQNYKSASFPLVETIIFDEFIIESKRRFYIPGEVDHLLSLISTVARNRKNVRTYCLSNAGYISNPYFEYYGVKSTDFQNEVSFVKRYNGKVIFEFFRPPNNDAVVKDSMVASISGKSYVDYAFKSKFMDSSEDLVDARPPGATPYVKFTDDGTSWYTLYTSSAISGFWIDRRDSKAQGFTFSDKLVLSDSYYSASAVARIKSAINLRMVSFASPDVRATFLGILGRN